ncbi:MAG: BLUF domain-containing protein [Bacteroidota bacterium]
MNAGENKLVGIVYISREVENFDDDDLNELITQAMRNNKELNITGFVAYRKSYFLQYIEGSEGIVKGLMNTIATDPRHEVLLTSTLEIEKRKFPKWDMFWSKNQLSVEIVLLDYLKTLDPKQIEEEKYTDNILRMLDTCSGLASKWDL